MALVDCPECGAQISDRAVACPKCGYGRGPAYPFWAGEYKSRRTLFGLPLVHVVYGPNWDPTTGRLRIAKGIIAIGGIAVGGLAFGGLSFGLLAFGGMAVGLCALGGLALGLLLAMGGAAIGGIALGGLAIGYIAIGGAAFGAYIYGGSGQSPELVEWLRAHFDWMRRP